MFTCLVNKADSDSLTQSCSHDSGQSFRYGCCCKEAKTDSTMWMLHIRAGQYVKTYDHGNLSQYII